MAFSFHQGTGCLLGVVLALSSLACGNDKKRPSGLGSPDEREPASTSPTSKPKPPATCSTPQEGCPCHTEEEIIDCGKVIRRSGDYVACSMGTRLCLDGQWGACEGDKIAMIEEAPPGQHAQALGMASACVGNPCDPFCQSVIDNSNGLDISKSPGLAIDPTGLTLTPAPPDPQGVNCTGIKLTPATQTLTVTAINPGNGLYGEYFNRRDNTIAAIPSTWTVTGTRVDPTINFDWGSGAPGVSGIGVDDFTVRWTGTVTPPATGAYVFYARGDDGVRLWINGAQVVNAWVDQGPTEYPSIPITLTQGVPANIKMEYFEHGGGAVAQLSWSSATISKQTIPETYLAPPGSSVAPFVTSPAGGAQVTASVTPPECYDGTFAAAWGLDKLDRATVSTTGLLTLQSPLAGPIAVSAYVQEFKDTATVNVVVNATDVLEAPTGAANTFATGTASGADPASILYPYDGTVLPLALKPPVLQWDTGGSSASAVKVSLIYPATGTPLFSWSKVMSEPATARYAFSRNQWGLFERSAKGGTGKIVLQRIVGGALKLAESKTVVFATAPLRGQIYYTQYGGGGSDIKRLDPGGDNAPVQAFASANGCPVCHSMSANGNKFATSNWTWSSNGGISDVNADGSLTVLSDFQNPGGSYTNGNSDWRGFAWAPLTPDGKYIFSTNNVYGNTRQQVVGIDLLRNVSLPSTMLSGGRGTGLQADYYTTSNWTGNSWRRIDAQPYFDWLLSPGGPIPADGFSVVWNGSVEGLFTEAYTFEVEASAGVRLTVGGTVLFNQLSNNLGVLTNKFTGVANLTAGQLTSIKLETKDQNSETIVKLRWSSANTPYGLVPQSQLFPAGGQRGALVTYKDTSNNTLTRLESDLYSDWGTLSPAKGVSGVTTDNINADNFTSTWDAIVEAPATDNLTFCINSDDGYRVTVTTPANVTTTVLNNTASTNNAFVCATTAIATTAGDKLKVHVDHTEVTGSARMLLGWKTSSFITTQEPIPSARIFPPSTWSAPTTGLSATFYDTEDFGVSKVPLNSTTPQGYSTYIPYVDFDWGGDRYSYGRSLTSSDTMSGRFTGRLQPACTGVHEFEIYADDSTSIWIGGERLINQGAGTKYAARWLDATQLYDFKVDWIETYTNAYVRLRWKPACNGATTYTSIPQANFRPVGDTTLHGYQRQGGDNGNGYPYVAWQTPTTVGSGPIDVTSQSPGVWGLGAQTVMMVPTFSPDGTRLTFVDGDSAMGAGWRKGLSTYVFDQANKVFKTRKQIVNNFPYGDVIKWPTFESDSKSVIYQTTTPGDMCCRNAWTLYGYMGPTNYFEDPGRLWSVDASAATPTPVALDKLNQGERNIDRNKSYQATMLPRATGGYRWAVFTSTRPYGNILNLPATQQDYSNTANNGYIPELNTAQIQSMLWVSAIDDTASGATDRSHQAFFLPNQSYSESGGHYLNERAYWVTEACRPAGTTSASVCDVDEDCCGGAASPPTAVCRIDTPVSSPPTRHCAAVPPPNACIAAGGACSTDNDCCFKNPCVANVCTKPPPLPKYVPTNFVRMYTAECGKGTKALWRFFDWKAVTPADGSAIEVYAETADDPSKFQTLPVAPTAVALTGVVPIFTITGATVSGWTGKDIGAALDAAKLVQKKYLNITLRLIPNAKKTAAPSISDWRQSFSCPPSE